MVGMCAVGDLAQNSWRRSRCRSSSEVGQKSIHYSDNPPLRNSADYPIMRTLVKTCTVTCIRFLFVYCPGPVTMINTLATDAFLICLDLCIRTIKI